MKILLVIFHADPARGGAERYTTDLAAALAQRGHKVSIAAQSFVAEIAPVGHVLLQARGLTRRSKYLSFLHSLEIHLSSHRYDIVHAMLPVWQCDVYHPHAGIAAESLAVGHKKYNNPISRLLSRLGNQFNLKRLTQASVERSLLESPRPPVVLCLSDAMKQIVRRHYRLGEKNLQRLFNAVNLQKYDPVSDVTPKSELRRRLNLPCDGVQGLLMAQNWRLKGVREAITALAQVPDKKLNLVIVGRDDPRPYRKLADSLGVSNQVIFAGATTDPASYYRAADFCLLPTYSDVCSLVVLESLAMGLPVISTRFNGACEIMEEGKHGFILDDPRNIKALANALSAMLDEPRRQQMSQASLALRPQLSYETHLDNLLKIYASVKTH